jgi:hypothetical protein
MQQVISTVLQVVNPLLYFKDFFLYAYPYFFFLNVGVLFYYLVNDSRLRRQTRRLIAKSHPLYLILLSAIMVFLTANCLVSMQPLNNLVPPTLEELYQANQFAVTHKLVYLTRSLGLSSLLMMVKAPFYDSEDVLICSILGIITCVMTVFTLFLILKRITGNDTTALMGCMLFVSLSSVVFYFSSNADSSVITSFLLLLLVYLYITGADMPCILFCTTLLAFIRIENLVFLFIFTTWFLLQHRFQLRDIFLLVLGYVLFIPQIAVLYNVRPFTMGTTFFLGLGGIPGRLSTIFASFRQTFGIIFLLFLLLGLVYALREKLWAVLMPFFLVVLYGCFQLNNSIPYRYLVSLLPLTVLVIATGFHLLQGFNSGKAWRLTAMSVFIVLVVFVPPHHLFMQFEKDPAYIQANIIAAEKIKDKKVILYGYDDIIYNYQRFYKNYQPYWNLHNNTHSFEYVVHFSEGDYDKPLVERALQTNVTFIERLGHIIYLYRIDSNP